MILSGWLDAKKPRSSANGKDNQLTYIDAVAKLHQLGYSVDDAAHIISNT